MTTQTAVIAAASGKTLTGKLFTLAAPDTVAYTADSVTERTNAKGEYVATFGEAAAINGDHVLILLEGTRAAARGYRTFTGTDTEVATETPETVNVGINNDKTGYSISGTTTTLDALQAGLIADHGAGSWVTATGFSTLTQSDIRAAIGMAAANLDTLIGAIQTVVDTNQVEILKIPRLGTTHKHRQIASNAVAKSADVIIEAAP